MNLQTVLDGQGKWFVHRLPIRDNELYASCSINVLINGGSAFQGLMTGTHVNLNITTGVRPFAGLRLDTEFTREEKREHQQDLIVKTGVTLPDGWFFSSSRLGYSRLIDLNPALERSEGTGKTKRKGLNAFNFDISCAGGGNRALSSFYEAIGLFRSVTVQVGVREGKETEFFHTESIPLLLVTARSHFITRL